MINIRPVDEQDVSTLFNLINESKNHLLPYLPWIDNINCIRDELAFIQDAQSNRERGKQYVFVIEKEENIVGMIDLHQVDYYNRQAEVGYWLSKKYTGKGIMSVALELLHKYAFNTLKLHKLIILVDEANKKSIQVAKRANYYHEGTFIDDKYYHGTFHNFERFACINQKD